MRVLIVEDDFTSRVLLQKLLAPYGECDVVVDGEEAVEAFSMALAEGEPYRLVCLDIMMPRMDGQRALKTIRRIEKVRGISPRSEAKVVMTTALDSPREVMEAYYQGGCSGYLVKPIEKARLQGLLAEMGLVG